MKKQIEKNYEAPSAEIIRVEVEERIFSDSLTGNDINGMGNGPSGNFEI